jgi:hypothetical protein
LASSSAAGSCLRTARRAVGAQKSALSLYSSMRRQNAPASGVPTGLPSYKSVEHPANSGPYRMYECPTTQPRSEAAKYLLPTPQRIKISIDKPSACARSHPHPCQLPPARPVLGKPTVA